MNIEVDPENDTPLKFHETIYFLVVTLATVGYGDIHPTTVAGQITITLAICVGSIIIIPYYVSKLLEKINEYSPYKRALTSEQNRIPLLAPLYFLLIHLCLYAIHHSVFAIRPMYSLFAPVAIRPSRYSPHSLFTPFAIRPIHYSPNSLFAPFTIRPIHYSPHSLFAIRYSLFAIRYSLFAIRYSLFAIRYSQFAIRNSQFAIRNSLFAIRIRNSLFEIRYSKFAIRNSQSAMLILYKCDSPGNRHYFARRHLVHISSRVFV
jgi:Ion channel